MHFQHLSVRIRDEVKLIPYCTLMTAPLYSHGAGSCNISKEIGDSSKCERSKCVFLKNASSDPERLSDN